jgi:hypothetical protein
MKFAVYFYSVIRVIIFCGMGYLISWLLEDANNFFGDQYVPIKIEAYSNGTPYETGGYWVWSGRHIWATVLSSALICISLVDMIIGTIRMVKKNYDTSKW